jgi:hypothetical protein
MSVKFEVRPGDRVRLFLSDGVPEDRTLDITPWDIPGVRQKGLVRAASHSRASE